MSRAHSTFIPAEQVSKATDWKFSAVDQAALRFAAKLKAQAEAEERSHNTAARDAGHAAGFAEGFAQGHAKATLEGQKQIAQYIATQGQEAADRYLAMMASTATQLAQAEQAMAKGVLELACELARQVLRHELATNPNVLQPVVREALGVLTADAKVAAVRMHPTDVEVFAQELTRAYPNLSLRLVPDTGITPGGCLVESAGTVVDATVEQRWRKTVATLGLDSQWESDHGAG